MRVSNLYGGGNFLCLKVVLVNVQLCPFPNTNGVGTTYLDHAGTTLYPKNLMDEFSRKMMSNLWGNPHSSSTASQLSTSKADDVRLRALRFFNADPDHFDLIFVANATAGIKAVMEGFREHANSFWYGYHKDSHTSMVGVREVAKAGHRCFLSDSEVEEWLLDPKIPGDAVKAPSQLGLFAYPAQSGMDGRRLPLSWPQKIRSSGSGHVKIYTLLDAAAFASTSPLDLSDTCRAPDYTVLSFYKIFGFPDLGALIVRKASGKPLSSRSYFSGGTVEMVSCITEQWHVKKQNSLHEQLEDGTLPIHSIIALGCALDVHEKLYGSMGRVSTHTAWLAKILHHRISALCHGNGSEICRIYKSSLSVYGDSRLQGPVIALNFLNSKGEWVSDAEVEKLALIKNIQFRRGGLCNPGGIMTYLQLSPSDMKRNFRAGHRCGGEGVIMGEKPTGAIRLSLGAMSTLEDVTRFVDFVEQFFVDPLEISSDDAEMSPGCDFFVEDLMVYPIKSCGGWSIPPNLRWDVRAEGLAWDREWCLVHQGTRVALSQKRYPQMALLKPSISLDDDLLRIRYRGPPRLGASEINVPLTPDARHFYPQTGLQSRICGEDMELQLYRSEAITAFFTNAIGIPCLLARYPPSHSRRPTRNHRTNHAPHQSHHLPQPMPGAFPTFPPTSSLASSPLRFSNESPILTISRSSLNRLNEEIRRQHGKEATAAVFRANIILAQNPAALTSSGGERPYAEDHWRYMHIRRPPAAAEPPSAARQSSHHHHHYYFEILGGCRRCQMVCVDQDSGEKNEEPFVTLARTRRMKGQVFFGVHTRLLRGRERDEGGEGGGGGGSGGYYCYCPWSEIDAAGAGNGIGFESGFESGSGIAWSERATIQIGDLVTPM